MVDLVALATRQPDASQQAARRESILASRQNRLMAPMQFQAEQRQQRTSNRQTERALDLRTREQLQQLGQNQRKQVAENFNVLGRSAYALSRIEDPQQRFQVYQEQVVPLLEQRGMGDLIQRVQSPEQLSDENLSAVIAQAEEGASMLGEEGGGFTLSPGQRRFDEQGNVVASVAPSSEGGVTSFDEYMNTSDQPITTPAGVQVQPGERFQLDRRDPADARFLRQTRGIAQAPSRQEQGEPGAFEPTAPETRALANAETATRNFIDTSNRVISLIGNNEQALGSLGDINQGINAASSFIEGAIQTLNTAEGSDQPVFTVTENGEQRAASAEEVKRRALEGTSRNTLESIRDTIGKKFQGSAMDAARIDSLIVDLAFMAAAASGQTGRSVSDRDVQRFLQQIGQSQDPDVFAAVLRDMQGRVKEKFENQFQTINRRLPENQRLSPPEFIEPGGTQRFRYNPETDSLEPVE